MKSEINIPVLTNEKFSKEALTDMVNALEQLEIAKSTIFNRLNSAFQERVNKLCDIKARINRANEIIASYTSITDPLTLKSKYHYPTTKHSFYTPTVIDQNATTLNKQPIKRLNRLVLNDKANLGSKSLAAKDKIVTYDKYLSSATQFNDIVNELDKISNQEVNVRQSLDEFEPLLNYVTNDFTFGTNMKIEYAKKQQYNPQQDFVNRGSSIVLQDFLNEKKAEEEKKKKIIQQAPRSIIERRKIKGYKKKRKKLKQNKAKINFNLPTNIGLGGVAELGGDDEEEKNEEKNEEEEEEEDDDFQDNDQIYPQFDDNQDMEDETNMPIDYIRINNKTKIETNRNAQNIKNAQPNNQNINQNNNQNSNQNLNQTNNDNNNNFNNNNINTAPNQAQPIQNPPPAQPQPPKPVVQRPPQRAQNPPQAAPSAPVKVVVGSGAGIPPPPPPPPPPPVVPTVPTKASSAANSGPKVNLEDELKNAMHGLKTVKVEEKQEKKTLSLAEELALSRQKLKKPVIAPKKEEKKQNAKDLLSRQIRLRFQILRMHEDEKESDSDSDDFELDKKIY